MTAHLRGEAIYVTILAGAPGKVWFVCQRKQSTTAHRQTDKQTGRRLQCQFLGPHSGVLTAEQVFLAWQQKIR